MPRRTPSASAASDRDFTRTEYPVVDMTNEAVRLLVDRISRGAGTEPRNVVFQPALVVGDSCAPRCG